jgi:hypothetical protein
MAVEAHRPFNADLVGSSWSAGVGTRLTVSFLSQKAGKIYISKFADATSFEACPPVRGAAPAGTVGDYPAQSAQTA